MNARFWAAICAGASVAFAIASHLVIMSQPEASMTLPPIPQEVSAAMSGQCEAVAQSAASVRATCYSVYDGGVGQVTTLRIDDRMHLTPFVKCSDALPLNQIVQVAIVRCPSTISGLTIDVPVLAR